MDLQQNAANVKIVASIRIQLVVRVLLCCNTRNLFSAILSRRNVEKYIIYFIPMGSCWNFINNFASNKKLRVVFQRKLRKLFSYYALNEIKLINSSKRNKSKFNVLEVYKMSLIHVPTCCTDVLSGYSCPIYKFKLTTK